MSYMSSMRLWAYKKNPAILCKLFKQIVEENHPLSQPPEVSN